jgi:hypothetical protein
VSIARYIWESITTSVKHVGLVAWDDAQVAGMVLPRIDEVKN